MAFFQQIRKAFTDQVFWLLWFCGSFPISPPPLFKLYLLLFIRKQACIPDGYISAFTIPYSCKRAKGIPTGTSGSGFRAALFK